MFSSELFISSSRLPNKMTDTFRALCAELHAAFNTYAVGEEHHQLLVRAAAALAQPEPQRPTVMEIIALADEVETEGLGQVDLVRRALERWGRPAIEPGPQHCDTKQPVYVFKQKKKSGDGRDHLLAIPEDQIQSVETIFGSHNVYLKVNDFELRGSFDELVQRLGERVNIG